jgi:hypothetical protein
MCGSARKGRGENQGRSFKSLDYTLRYGALYLALTAIIRWTVEVLATSCIMILQAIAQLIVSKVQSELADPYTIKVTNGDGVARSFPAQGRNLPVESTDLDCSKHCQGSVTSLPVNETLATCIREELLIFT